MKALLRKNQKLGKYRVGRRLAQGGFAEVYQAFDTIEGILVALKIPYPHLLNPQWLERFRKEVRLTARLDHPQILPIKNASFVDGLFVVASPLGERTLAERLKSRLAVRLALDFAQQMLEALAYAHNHRVLHCDIKPENFLLFPGDRIRLADFGIARVAQRTVSASGSGTIGYIAPEQAMGKPSIRSDVFSLGLVLYEMFSGKLPQWPFTPPLPGLRRLRQKLHPDFVAFLLRAIEIEPRRRFENADHMLRAFLRLKPRALRHLARERRRRGHKPPKEDWGEIRWRQFRRQFGKALEVHADCPRCQGPVAEAMQSCPWCNAALEPYRGPTRFPRRCARCRRGLKLDWRFCPWCYGPALDDVDPRQYSDVRYSARCSNGTCKRKVLMPFMRYCPWCHRKARRKWPLPGSARRCPGCGWGVASCFWDYCPWCTTALER